MKTRKYNIYDYLNYINGGGSGSNYGGGYVVDNTAAMLLNDWFYMSNGVLHCRYPFAGDSEISAYQAADSSTTIQTIKTALNGITASSTTAEIATALETINYAL